MNLLFRFLKMRHFNLTVEPQDHNISVDGFLCFHRNSSEKCMQMEDVRCEFGGKFGINWEEEHLLGQEVLDIMPSENESGEFQATKALFACEDYLLDIESGESITKLDYHLGKGSKNLVLESCTQADRADYNGTPQASELSDITNGMHDIEGGLDMNDYEPNGIFSCSADSELSIEDRWFKYPTSFTLESIDKLEDVSSMFSEENDKNMIFNPGLTSEEVFCPLITMQQSEYSSVGQNAERESNLEQDVSTRCPNHGSSIGPQAEKRLRKPPHRYIDELSEPKSRHIRKKREISTPTSKGKSSKIKHHKHDMKSTVERSFPEESAGKAIQVPFGPLICNESQKQLPIVPKVLHSKPVASVAPSQEDCVSSRKKQVPIAPKVIHSKPVASVTASEEDCVAMVKSGEDGGRRKHHIPWTVSEVKKLIDGVSQYGVGRWSHIKKDLFSSSPHRTAVDLKDKWRNLLKATCVQSEGRRVEDKKRNLAWRPLPKSVIRRVRDLAVMYPYPRDFQTKY